MILSEKHGFIFIKGMKVAGTSTEMALSQICGPGDIITPISQVDELERLRQGGRCRNWSGNPAQEDAYIAALRTAPRELLGQVPQPKGYYNHMPLTAVALRYGRDISGFRVIAVERSPYAKVMSWANMQLSYGAYRGGGAMQADPKALEAAVDRGFASGGIRDTRNIDRYRDGSGQMVAQPFRYATLAEDFAAFVQSLSLGEVPSLPHAKKGLLSDSLDPRAILRPDQIERINMLFADEFETFGYPKL
ncbi:MAG: hypothetical protein JO256_06445 [Alphaproteobacteria bacterium]|nr:hypothetical protein [Alphaproteobacteria bacterium]